MKEPLAQRLRPRTLMKCAASAISWPPGQVFRRTIDRGVIPNMIFYGPSGVGKNHRGQHYCGQQRYAAV